MKCKNYCEKCCEGKVCCSHNVCEKYAPTETKEELFFEVVKGKKIKMYTWCKEYIIPYKLIGDTMSAIDSRGKHTSYSVHYLFDTWEFYKEPKKITLYRYTYRTGGQYESYGQTPWVTREYYAYGIAEEDLVKTETKEVEL